MGGLRLLGYSKAQIEELISQSGGLNKAEVEALLATVNAIVYKGVVDCSGNPNYPTADAGHLYRVSVAGKIGGGSGINVEAGDTLLCNTDGSSAGTQAAVGSKWNVIQANIDGGVVGPASATDSHVAVFSGSTGKALQDGGVALSSFAPATETVKTVTESGEALTVKLAEGTEWDITLTKNCVLTLPTPEKGKSFALTLRQDGTGGRTVTWPASTRWSGGVYPLFSTAKESVDVVSFACVDGEHWLGYFDGKGFAAGGSEPAGGMYGVAIPLMGTQVGSEAGANTYALLPNFSTTTVLTGNCGHGIRELDPAVFATEGRKPRYKLRVNVATNAVAPAADFTVELRKVLKTAGAAGVLSISESEAVAGLSAKVTAPAKETSRNVAESADVEAPAAGSYILAVVTSAKTGASSMADVSAVLQVH